MTSQGRPAKFSIPDEDDTTLDKQDSEEVRKLNDLALHEKALGRGTAQSLAGSAPVSRTTSLNNQNTGRPTSTATSRQTSKVDALGSHSRIHTPDGSPPSTPKGDPR